MKRRSLLIGLGAAGALAGLGAISAASIHDPRPLALVYRGPASSPGCPEAVAKLLESAPTPLRVRYCGPDEEYPLTSDSLRHALVYAQPGGGQLAPAWRIMREHADDVRDWVHSGGRYLGFCLGGYLAGSSPGFRLLPGDTTDYVSTDDATIRNDRDTTVRLRWRGTRRTLYFQDGPAFRLRPHAPATVLARYENAEIAATVTPCGAGRVGVVGPHPEADRSWFDAAGLHLPSGVYPDLGHDLVEATVDS